MLEVQEPSAQNGGVTSAIRLSRQALTKEYLGEVAIPLEEWFGKDEDGKEDERTYGFDQHENVAFSLDLVSTRTNIQATGSIQVKLGFAPAPDADPQNSMPLEDVYAELLRRTRPLLISAPPTEGVGTIRSQPGPSIPIQYEEDGGIPSDSDSVNENENKNRNKNVAERSLPAAKFAPKLLFDTYNPPCITHAYLEIQAQDCPAEGGAAQHAIQAASAHDGTQQLANFACVKQLTRLSRENRRISCPRPHPLLLVPIHSDEVHPENHSTQVPAPQNMLGDVAARHDVASESSPLLLPAPAEPANCVPNDMLDKIFDGVVVRGALSVSGVGPSVGLAAAAAAGGGGTELVRTKRRNRDWELKHANDIIRVVVLEVEGADDLPEWSNPAYTGWDMDPFVVVAFSKKVLRAGVIRHSLQPRLRRKALFPSSLLQNELPSTTDRSRLGQALRNDLVGNATFRVNELVDDTAKPDEETGVVCGEG
ncbi:hypothetical protein GALMADRAFT_216867 [Galerina marginata CBS 339.88]|uniref:C2 domain-containing protein n=1 Tax=Galerina marginata (strain CBS 339.88) TaxID=685588 RepID=A0A067S9M0_GALM3|nr:hypothetical protein GALMADRAFT_216867 [Galerina marginata CBS 339.88]